jgi:protein gp37
MKRQHNAKTGARGIEWTDFTGNRVVGCPHGCRWTMPDGTVAACYGETQDESPRLAPFYPRGFAHHYWGPEALSDLAAGELLLVFVDSMSDLLAPAVPAEQVRAVLAAMRAAPHHAYHSLTKPAPPLLRYAADLPPNLWVGVSAPPDAMLDRALTREQRRRTLARALDVLARVKAATGNLVSLSAEPLRWDMAEVLTPDHPLDWAVIGAASKGRQTYQPAPDHLRRLLEVLDATAPPVFFKSHLRPPSRPAYLTAGARTSPPATGTADRSRPLTAGSGCSRSTARCPPLPRGEGAPRCGRRRAGRLILVIQPQEHRLGGVRPANQTALTPANDGTLGRTSMGRKPASGAWKRAPSGTEPPRPGPKRAPWAFFRGLVEHWGVSPPQTVSSWRARPLPLRRGRRRLTVLLMI